MKLCIHVRPRDDGQGWAVDVYDGRRAWAKTHAGHEWAQHEREGWTVCSRCGLVRNYDRESPCRRVMPEIEPRDGGAS